ncbi:MAG: alpha/beta hydrolase [Lacisediminihabitans sp.]
MNLAGWALVVGRDQLAAARWQLHYLARRGGPERYLVGGRQPVLLLPGVYEPWEFLRPVGDRLNALGHPVHLVREIGYNRRAIVPTAELVARFLIERDLRHVIIVGHSKGGLIGKQLMVTDAVADRIDRMVAINSPFSGSRLARFAPGATLRAFAPTNPLLSTLARNREANSRIVSIFSRFDPNIPEGSRLDGAVNIELPISGHFRPLDRLVLLAAVERAIESAQGTE